jgi:hypothetical protein
VVAGNVIDTHEHAGELKEWSAIPFGIEPNKKQPPMSAVKRDG